MEEPVTIKQTEIPQSTYLLQTQHWNMQRPIQSMMVHQNQYSQIWCWTSCNERKDIHLLVHPFCYPKESLHIYKCKKIHQTIAFSHVLCSSMWFSAACSISQFASRANICSIQVTICRWFVNILPFKTYGFCWHCSIALPNYYYYLFFNKWGDAE